ncbi:MAG: hypothetical protein ABR875_04170 [Minisyncoccia bacterium]|jgi:hypothetical protein
MNKTKTIFAIQILVNLSLIFLMVGGGMVHADLVPTGTINLNQPINGNPPVTLNEVGSIVGTIGNFFILVAPILLIIALVLSAITIMTGGASPAAVTKGKKWLGYSVVAGLIIFGTGVIINTIAFIVTRDFFCQVSLLGVCILH